MPDEKTAAFLAAYDRFFDRADLRGAGICLTDAYEKAKSERDNRFLFTILNEMMGYYRQTGEKERGLAAVYEGLALTAQLGLETTVAGATAYLNAATTLKAFGRAAEGLPYYRKAETLYRRLLPGNDPRIANLCNNMALALVDLSEWREAEEKYTEALSILNRNEGKQKDIANTYVNLAHFYDKREDYEKLEACLKRAAEALDSDPVRNPYYAYTCRKCAPSFGYFGWFLYEKELRDRADRIYAGEA